MGRKRTHDGVSRRKKVLQLEKQPPAATPNSQYDGNDVDSNTFPPILQPMATANGGQSASNPMDTKLADFLAEIDALDSGPTTPVGPEDDGSTENQTQDAKIIKEVHTGESLSTTEETESVNVDHHWHDVLDTSTNCYYYWNAKTSEVTWEIPEALKKSVEQKVSAPKEKGEPTLLEKLTRKEADISGSNNKLSKKSEEDGQGGSRGSDNEKSLPEDEGKERIISEKDAGSLMKDSVVAVGAIVGYESRDEDSEEDKPLMQTDTDMKTTDEDEMMKVKDDGQTEKERNETNGHDEDNESDKTEADKTEADETEATKTSEAKLQDKKSSVEDDEDEGDLSRYELFDDDEDDLEDIDQQLEKELEQKKAELRKLDELFDDGGSDKGETNIDEKGTVTSGRKDTEMVSEGRDKGEDEHEDSDESKDKGEDEGEDEGEGEAEETDEDIEKLESDLKRKLAELEDAESASFLDEEMKFTNKKKMETAENQIFPVEEVVKRKLDDIVQDEEDYQDVVQPKKVKLSSPPPLPAEKRVEMVDVGVQCDEQNQEEEKIERNSKLKGGEEKKIKITDLISMLMNKLQFLGINKNGISKFQLLLVGTETRVQDWRDGMMECDHLLKKLEAAEWELERYESEAAPTGWSCHWDRNHKQYFYMNQASGDSQWEYPMEAMKVEQERVGETGKEDSQATFNRASSVEEVIDAKESSVNLVSSSDEKEEVVEIKPKKVKKSKAKLKKKKKELNSAIKEEIVPPPPIPAIEALSYDPPPPPEPDSISQPPPPPPPSEPYPPPPPPDEPPPPGTEIDVPPLPPSPPPPPPEDIDDVPPPPPMSPPPLPVEDEDDDEPLSTTSELPLSPMPLAKSPPPEVVEAPPELPLEPEIPLSTTIGKPQLYDQAAVSSLPQLYSDTTATAAMLSAGCGIDGIPMDEPSDVQSTAVKTVKKVKTVKTVKKGIKAKKIKKLKEKKLLAKKKIPHSLVEKWKQIKEDQAKEEEGSSSSADEDPTILNQRRIAEWKKDQVEKGKSQYNSNFDTIQGDWRERLTIKKKRKKKVAKS